MVKLFALSVFYKTSDSVKLLKSAVDLQSFSFFQRGSVQEFIGFASKTIVERTDMSMRQSVKQDAYMCHVYVRADGLSGVLIADHEYPQRVAHSLITKVLDDFTSRIPTILWTTDNIEYKFLPIYLAKYQDPLEGDALTRMQNDVDETKIILKNTLESVLERGEKIDDLVEKSEALSYQSKLFYTTAKKTNSCCTFL